MAQAVITLYEMNLHRLAINFHFKLSFNFTSKTCKLKTNCCKYAYNVMHSYMIRDRGKKDWLTTFSI